jgi:hypothetical protein
MAGSKASASSVTPPAGAVDDSLAFPRDRPARVPLGSGGRCCRLARRPSRVRFSLLLRAPADRLAWSKAVDWTVALDWLHRMTGVTLSPEQDAAVQLALTQRMAVLTGGPGCGKSYTVRAIVTLARAKHAKVLLAAPTGRAAKRLSELAGLQAATLHRLLQLRPGGDAAFDRDAPRSRRGPRPSR